jgi:hypothetical protein
MNKILTLAAAASLALALPVGGAWAATVSITYDSYMSSGKAAALAARDSFIGPKVARAEDFETGFVPCTGSNKTTCSSGTIVTEVGTFTGFGGVHTGGDSQVKPKDKIVVKSGTKNTYGRYNVTPGGANWLDSNDREGIRWTLATTPGLTFSRIAFLLTDLDDVGRIVFSITVDGGAAVPRPASEPGGNGRVHLVTMEFAKPVSSFDITMVNGTGDGFGFDGARIAAVPVPAAGLLLAGALGAVGLVARRRKAG